MKRFLLTCGLILIFFVAVSQSRIGMYNEVSIGGGGAYRLGIQEEFSAPGFNLESYYFFIREFRAGLDVSYYIAHGNFTPNAFEVNANAMGFYLFTGDWSFYGLGGLQFIWIDYYWGELFPRDRHYGVGVNIGAGVEFEIDYISIFAEPKITLYDVNSLRITSQFSLGVRYVF